MFDIGWSEMVFVGIIAILVIGPKDLPKTIATVGKYIRKARGFAREFQSGIDDLARDADLDELKKTVQSGDFNIKKQIEDAVDPTGDFSSMFDDVKPNIIDDKPSPNDSNDVAELPAENTISGSLEQSSEPTADTKVSP